MPLASSVSIALIVPWAEAERTNTAYRAPGSRRSSVYGRVPRRKGGSSTRRTEAPWPSPAPFDPDMSLLHRLAKSARRGTLTPPRNPRLLSECPALMIAPVPVDPQVPGREALEPETGAAHERQRPRVGGLDVGLQAVQVERHERLVQDQLERLAHVALAPVGGH